MQTETPRDFVSERAADQERRTCMCQEHNKGRADIALPRGLAGKLHVRYRREERIEKPQAGLTAAFGLRPLQVKPVFTLTVWSPPLSTKGRLGSAV